MKSDRKACRFLVSFLSYITPLNILLNEGSQLSLVSHSQRSGGSAESISNTVRAQRELTHRLIWSYSPWTSPMIQNMQQVVQKLKAIFFHFEALIMKIKSKTQCEITANTCVRLREEMFYKRNKRTKKSKNAYKGLGLQLCVTEMYYSCATFHSCYICKKHKTSPYYTWICVSWSSVWH